jgi:hypothetical protein
MATTIPRTPWIDDDGSGTTGTVLNNAIKTELYDQIDVALLNVGTAGLATLVSRSDTGTVTDWAPGLGPGPTYIQWSGASNLTVNGIAGGVRGQRFEFRNIGSAIATFVHFSATGQSQNRFYNIAKSASTPIGPDGTATWIYDGGTWNLVAHEQGAWITPPYSAANFVGTGGMVWTVEAGDLTVLKYRLSGRSVTLLIRLENTSISGTLTGQVHIQPAAYGAYVASNAGIGNRCAYMFDVGFGVGDGWLMALNTGVDINRIGGNFVATTTLSIYGQITFEVN